MGTTEIIERIESLERGMYFSKKEFDGSENRTLNEVRGMLPVPFSSAKEEYRGMYWYALSVLFRNMHVPKEGSGYVSRFVDAAFNKDIFLWDTCFMTVFCNLLNDYVPGISSLDNFYAKQFEDGEIPRELVRDSGRDLHYWVNAFDKPLYSFFHNHYGFRGLAKVTGLPYEDLYKPDLGRKVEKNPYLTLDDLNHPILAFAEWQSYLYTGDAERLRMVAKPLIKYYEALRYHIMHVSGLYVTDWASMDNSTRNGELYLGCDISCEMVLFARNLIDILTVADRTEYSSMIERLEREADETAELINSMMWDEEDGFYYDLDHDMKKIRIKTAAAFWALISGVADKAQQERLVWWLNDESTFNRTHRVPVLAADEPGFVPTGGYWRGSVWAPINTIVTLGLEKCGFHETARDIALNDLEVTSRVFLDTGTIWENYPADSMDAGTSDHPDFIGWSAIAPIWFYVSYFIGLMIDPRDGVLTWDADSALLEKGPLGIRNFAWRGNRASFSLERKEGFTELLVTADKDFSMRLSLDGKTELLSLHAGENRFELRKD